MLGIGIWIGQNVAAQSGGGVVATTWDPANSSTDWSFSPDKLAVTRTSTGAGFWAIARATIAKVNGTLGVTVNAIGTGAPIVCSIGFATGVETQYPGQDGTGNSVGYDSSGGIVGGGGTLATVATYTSGDVITAIKSGSTFTFKKNGTIVFGPTDLTAALGAGAPVFGATFPAASNGNGTGTQLTGDFSGW